MPCKGFRSHFALTLINARGSQNQTLGDAALEPQDIGSVDLSTLKAGAQLRSASRQLGCSMRHQPPACVTRCACRQHVQHAVPAAEAHTPLLAQTNKQTKKHKHPQAPMRA